MKRIITLFFLFLVFNITLYAQSNVIKKCKTCGKPIKECRYSGRHPVITTASTKQTLKESQKYLEQAKSYFTKEDYLSARSALAEIDEKYRDGDYWELYGDCEYFHRNSWSSNYWYDCYQRAIDKGNVSARDKLLFDIRHSAGFAGIGSNSNITEAMVLFDRAYHENNMDEKIRLYKSSAALGYPYAAFNLGRIYEVEGNGVSVNYAEAAHYFLMSESLVQSKLHLAWLYRHGLGVEKNLIKSFELYYSVAESSSSDYYCVVAMYNIATCYEGGLGVSKNQNIALEYYRKILDKSECESERRCIEMAAEKYYLLTIDRGLVDGKPPTGNYYYNIRSAYVKRKIKQQFWKQAAEIGVDCGEYQATIGNFYENEKNYDEALKWYLLAAENHVSRACWALGDFYENGKAVDKDLSEAKKWYEKAVEYGNSSAQKAVDRLKKKGY